METLTIETTVEKTDTNFDDKIKSINTQISKLNDSVSRLEEELEKDNCKDTVIMLFGFYQDLNEEYTHLSEDCMKIVTKFPNNSINTEYHIKKRLDKAHAKLNGLLYPQ